jgi:hypothetical protein
MGIKLALNYDKIIYREVMKEKIDFALSDDYNLNNIERRASWHF